MSELENALKSEMQASIEHLKQNLKTLRTGRASASILDKVQVEVYGSLMPLKSVANVTVPEPRQILVTPFDQGSLHAISKAIEQAKLGVNPLIDGKVVRINVPPMDESVRKQMAKQCKDLGEKTKVSLREVRRKHNEQIRKQKSAGDLPEDLMKKQEKLIQEMTDRFCKEVDHICSEKEKEILTV